MTILEMLKGAKPFLSNTADDNLPNHICFALDSYARSVNLHVYPESYCLAAMPAIPAKNYIHSKLADLARKSDSWIDYCFTDECACYILNIEVCEVTYTMRQQARHIWLDSLIAELEAEQSKTY